MHDLGTGKRGRLCFEHTELFLRGVGDTTDIVQKEMYNVYGQGEPEHYAEAGRYSRCGAQLY